MSVGEGLIEKTLVDGPGDKCAVLTSCIWNIRLQAFAFCESRCGKKATTLAACFATLMKKVGIESLFKKPHPSARHAADQVCRCRFRYVKIEQPDLAGSDTTYIPIESGSLHVFAVMDWPANESRRNSCRHDEDRLVPQSGGRTHCQHSKPQICNIDQGRQFNSADFTDLLT